MVKFTPRLHILLLTFICVTVTHGQYYDLLQGLQQLFQPYQQQNDFLSQYNNVNRQQTNKQINRQEQKKKTEQQNIVKNTAINQYDFVLSTTPKPSRKTTRPNSSHNKQTNNRHINTDIIFNDYSTFDVTTKKTKATGNRRTTTPRPRTTEAYGSISFNSPSSRRTTVKPKTTTDNFSNFNRPNNRPVTENVFQNKQKTTYSNIDRQENRTPNNSGNDYSSNSNRVTSSRNPNVENINLNVQNIANEVRPTNNRNPMVPINDQNRLTQNKNSNFVSTTNSNNNFNRVTKPNNFGNNYNNDRGILNTDFDVGSLNSNPLINRPGVRPAAVDPNQAPITNRPATDRNNFVPFDRPGETEGDVPEILLGPDEDDMTEQQKRRYIETSERMCDRYKNLDVKEVVALPLLPSPDPVELNVSSCVPITIPLVIGGRVASINEFPHMALVGWRKIRGDGYSWKCGGSLISNQYILSAGHCTYQDKDYDVVSGPPQAVQLGSTYLDDPAATVVKISAVIRHPKYKQRRSYYDIALLKLAQTVTFSETIRPACLGVPPPVGDSIIATGWGRTEFSGDHSTVLRSVSLPVWNMAECRDIWGTSLKLPNGPSADSHMCAGERQGGKDTCQGDSGGPAQVQDGCVWRVVAVTSFGRSCGAPNTPALYAVTKRAFIAAQVFGDQVDQGNRNQGFGGPAGNRNQGPQRFDNAGNRNQGAQQFGGQSGIRTQTPQGVSRNQGSQRFDQGVINGNQRFDQGRYQGSLNFDQGVRNAGSLNFDQGLRNQGSLSFDEGIGNRNQGSQRFDQGLASRTQGSLIFDDRGTYERPQNFYNSQTYDVNNYRRQ